MQRRHSHYQQKLYGMISLFRLNWPIKFTAASICASKPSFKSGSSLISATQPSQMAFFFSHSLRLYQNRNKKLNKTKMGDFHFHCTEDSGNFQCACTFTHQVRAGKKNPSTSAHSLKKIPQRCSLTLAKHAESRSKKEKGMNYKKSRPLIDIRYMHT